MLLALEDLIYKLEEKFDKARANLANNKNVIKARTLFSENKN